MDLFVPIDQYCERIDQSLFSEPLNLLSNLGFIVSALVIFRRIRNTTIPRPYGSKALTGLGLAIGIGSALFHSYAVNLTKWCDVLPILVFLITYLWLFLRHIVTISRRQTSIGILGFLTMTGVAGLLADHETSNGSQWYFGTWISLFAISSYYAGRSQFNRQKQMLTATALFSLALFFRTIDMKVCDGFPMGTHFLWHLLNAGVIFLVMDTYIFSQDTKFDRTNP